MTTKQIIEADETGRFPERACGQAGALIRGHMHCLDIQRPPWEQSEALRQLAFEGNAQDSPELRMLRRLRGRVI